MIPFQFNLTRRALGTALACLLPALVFANAAGTTIEAGPETEIHADNLEFLAVDEKATFVFSGNVVVNATNLNVTCDRMEITSLREAETDAAIGRMGRIQEIDATGNVIIRQGDRRATSGRAVLRPVDGLIVLTINPVLVDPQGIVAGEKITLFRGESRAVVERPRLILNQIPDLGPGTRSEGAAPTP
jgi:lipopolysaccharide export system protein LptA